MRPKDQLEIEADRILAADLKDKRRNKVRTAEYPILSDSQLDRRRSMEIPFSSLSKNQERDANSKNDMDE